MKKLSYQEALAEVEKPIYEQSAIEIWDYTYELFKGDINASEVAKLGGEILWCIEIETKYNLKNSIFEIARHKDTDDESLTVEFFKVYFQELLVKPNFYKPDFLIENIEKLCKDNKLIRLLSLFDTLSGKIGKDLMFLLNGGYFDQGDYDFLYNYGFTQTNKRIVREYTDNNNLWVIKSLEGTDKDYILDDMTFVWPAIGGFSRFLNKDGKWGFIDIVSNEKYFMPDYVHSMNDCVHNRAVYRDNRNGLFGYINHKGEIIIPPKYTDAMDFMYFRGELLAVVKLSMDEEYKLRTDPERKNIMGENEEMGISIFNQLITIDIQGNFTSEIQKKYEEEKSSYYKKVESAENESSRVYTTDNSDDEEDIMNALENGYGDIYGF